MALVVKDRVSELSTTTGTGTLTLGGAETGFQTFSSAIGNGNTTYYAITLDGEWEVGIGTVGAGILTRDTVLESSNSGSLVNFSAGTKNVFCTYPAERSVNTEDIGVSIQAYDADTTKNDVANTFTANQVISVTDNTNAALRITQVGTGNALVVEDETNPDSTRFVIDASGNVGIGTSSPSSPLSFANSTGQKITLFSNYSLGVESSEFRLATNGIFAFRTEGYAGTERMRIGSSGGVSIGTTDTTSWGNGFTVYNLPITGVRNFGGSGSANIIARALGTAQSQLAGYSFYPTFVGTGDNGPRRAADIWSGFDGGNWGTQYLAFGVGNATNDAQDTTPERMRIDSSGNVGIGTASPTSGYKLDVAGNFKVLGSIDENIYAVVDAAGVALSPQNGTIQTWTLGASRTPTLGTWNAGESMTLMINDGTAYTVTWTTMGIVWVGGTAPTLATSGYTVVELWRVGSTYYGALVGEVA